ncbi:MAG: DUF4054 domain-containing protein [Acidobacteriia bacterium]|nr:DUF4054 domain-containing protein [Terriglobia bacterium]
MDLNTITVADFKAQFYRDFPYLPVYDPAALYNTGDIVYYAPTLLFYQCQVDGVTGVTPGSDATKWIKYLTTLDNYVQDQDITNAFTEAQVLFNQALLGTDATIRLAYLYLTAHFLCNDMRAAAAGISSSGSFPVQSRTVGSVSEAYQIPDAYKNNPNYAFYITSAYGMKYLQMILPNLIGNMQAVFADANP